MKLSIVVSVYNEELSLPVFYDAAREALDSCDSEYELIFVNDGSTDNSEGIINGFARENTSVKLVSFARNFGHEAAMIAGIDYATGDYVVCMDADMQHPPRMLPEILEKFSEGYDIVSMVRTKNSGAGLGNRLMSGMFYRILNLFSPVKFEKNSSDFFAVSRRVADVLRNEYRENVRYLRGLVQMVGFDKTTLEFEADRRVAGESKYNFRKLLKFSLRTLFTFSDFPLKLGIYSGFIVAAFGVILMIYSIINRLLYDTPAGYSTIIVALCFLFAVTLCVLGVIGEYISILFAEIKGRPIYTVKQTVNLDGRDKEKNG
jgi:dolichol-phosphate mannosyltransferase